MKSWPLQHQSGKHHRQTRANRITNCRVPRVGYFIIAENKKNKTKKWFTNPASIKYFYRSANLTVMCASATVELHGTASCDFGFCVYNIGWIRSAHSHLRSVFSLWCSAFFSFFCNSISFEVLTTTKVLFILNELPPVGKFCYFALHMQL